MEETKIYQKKCKICDKIIKSLSKPQFEYNYNLHIKSHERKKEGNKNDETSNNN